LDITAGPQPEILRGLRAGAIGRGGVPAALDAFSSTHMKAWVRAVVMGESFKRRAYGPSTFDGFFE
jgi:hypothetical protein